MVQGECHDLDSVAEFFGDDLAFYRNSSISCYAGLSEFNQKRWSVSVFASIIVSIHYTTFYYINLAKFSKIEQNYAIFPNVFNQLHTSSRHLLHTSDFEF